MTPVESEVVYFVIVGVFSFLIGLEVRSYKEQFLSGKKSDFFGDVRTYTFVGILGFVLYIIGSIVYLGGFLVLSLLYALLYEHNLRHNERSILLFIVMLLVYSFGALVHKEPFWMTALLYVSIVFVLNSNMKMQSLLRNINLEEFETLGKMILLSAVILPLLPDERLVAYIPLSPFKIWLAVVVISAISYGGYILQKYFFPAKGYFLTGILGGIYSSTATTVVLARKAKSLGGGHIIDAAIISATAVMYLRLVVIAFIFNREIGELLALPFVVLSGVGFAIAFFYMKRSRSKEQHPEIVDKNPLELKTAFVFALLFVLIMVATQYVTRHYGSLGLEILSFVVGFTDIDPFILSMLTGKFPVSQQQIIAAIMIASGSNNLLKAFYALWFAGVKKSYKAAAWVALLGIVTIAYGLYLEQS